MIQVVIRREAPADSVAIAELLRLAFGTEIERRIVDRIRALPEYLPKLSLVGETEGRIVGQILLSLLHHEDPAWEGKLLALGPIAVEPTLQRQGIGASLMNEAVSRAKSFGYSGIVLIGHPTYYPRFGFRPASTWDIQLPFEVPDDVAMALPLFAGGLDEARGRVFFSEAFGQ